MLARIGVGSLRLMDGDVFEPSNIESYGAGEEHGDRGVETRTGNLAFCALFIAALQASEAVKVLLGKKDLLRDRLFIVDLMTNSFDIVLFA